MFLFLALVVAVSTLAAARPSNLDEFRPRREASNDSTIYIGSYDGVFSTPNYPNNYANKMDRVYRIEADNYPSGTVNFYACDCHIEDSYYCDWDFIQFGRNGSRECGNESGSSYSAQAQGDGIIEVVFHSDYIVNTKGCEISWGVDATRSELISKCSQQSYPNVTIPNFDFDPNV